MEFKFAVEGMHCASCPLLIDDMLEDLPGVVQSRTSLTSAECVVEAENIPVDELIATIKAAGYTAQLL